MNPTFFIRAAQAEDAAEILNAHYQAVHQSAKAFYTAEICECWSPAPDEKRIAHYRDSILPREYTLVAEEADTQAIMGYGVVECDKAYIKAVYVHPEYARRGVGKKLLKALEAYAKSQNITELHLSASLNSESFYKSQGYQLIAHDSHRLNGGLEMACIKFKKSLDSEENAEAHI